MPRPSHSGPRLLLRRLREVMAAPVSAQARLDQIVSMIAGNMVAEVCSVYVLRADGLLELYATEGLNRSVVHAVQMKSGEGLVGTVAKTGEPLNLPQARDHPSFLYFPELGEDMMCSFLGVPILRAGDTLGVLVVQNKRSRTYSEEEVEALETLALILAEIIASGDLAAIAKPGTLLASRRPLQLNGVGLNDALGLGHVVLHVPRISGTKLVAEDSAQETGRLDDALNAMQASIDDLMAHEDLQRGEQRDVMEAYRLVAQDQRWAAKIREAIETGLTAEAAVGKVQSDIRARMLRAADPYLRERLHDFDDLANRLLRMLAGASGVEQKKALPKDAIVVARNMGPAELLDYDRSRLRGLVLEEGSGTSHATIVARALGIACVGQVENILTLVEEGDPIIVDGQAGHVHVRPPAHIEQAYAEKVRFRARRLAHYRDLRLTKSLSRDQKKIDLFLNAGLLVDLPYLEQTNADGIGLFRTELQFMVAETLPRVSQQQELYSQVVAAAGDKPVIFRSLDVGGDKILPYLPSTVEENPAMGWRAIRLTLDRPGLFKSQARALLLACAGRDLHMLFPMITQVDEMKRARQLVELEARYLATCGHAVPARVLYGAMVEVPAILWQLDDLAPHVDFLSVGSNDLQQFLFAADRSNARLHARFDPLSAPMLRVLKHIAMRARAHNLPVTLCGELASKPLEAMAILGLGFSRISMSAAAIGPVKGMVQSVDLGAVSAFLDERLQACDSQKPLRAVLQDFAARNNVAMG